MTEVQRYEVLKAYSGFELRRYADHTLVTKPMGGAMGPAASAAFGYLAGYISGQNQSQQKIEMTAPVLQRKTNSGFDVSFVMPHEMTEAPAPLGSDMRVERVTGALVAAKRFNGAATDSLFERKALQLLQEVQAAGLAPVSEVQYARYNGPWTPTFLRRNEVLVEISRP